MIELRTGRRHQTVLATEESQAEALALAHFFVNDPRDLNCPRVVFLWDTRAQQYCGWAERDEPTKGAK